MFSDLILKFWDFDGQGDQQTTTTIIITTVSPRGGGKRKSSNDDEALAPGRKGDPQLDVVGKKYRCVPLWRFER